jgi:hypothetical protein
MAGGVSAIEQTMIVAVFVHASALPSCFAATRSK